MSAARQIDLFHNPERRAPERYPDTPGFKERTTSKEAAEANASRAPRLRTRALRLLVRYPDGLTADEIAARLDTTVLAMRPRISELSDKGLVARTGERRANESGMLAHVMRITTAGRAVVAA